MREDGTRRKRTFGPNVLWVLAAALVLASGWGCGADRRSDAPVILISIDGFWSGYVDYGVTPTLERLAREGVRAEAMQPVFPTKTFPNHYTIVTGLYAEDHGIVANSMWDPARRETYGLSDRGAVRDWRWYGGEPIWVTAETQGQFTAPLFWPGSEADIKGVAPFRRLPYSDDFPNVARVDSVLAWLDLPASRRPTFLTLYFSDVDNAGHDTGTDTPELRAALERVDALLARLVAGLEARGVLHEVNVIVVSDHGMATTSPDRVIVLDDVIDAARVRVSDLNPVAAVWPVDTTETDSIVAALRRGSDRWRVWRKDSVPARFHYRDHPRIAPIIVLADEGWSIARREGFRPQRFRGANHGYDNALPSMQALFVAHGPAFKQAYRAPAFQNIHLYALMTHLLRLEAAWNRGSLDSVRGMLR